MKTQKQFILTFLIAFIGMFTCMSFIPCNTKKAPLEKIYTQTDRPFYFPGETIWFKSYIVKANNTVSLLSDIVNAELISPKGATVKKIKLSVENGYAYGDFDIDNNWVGGIYTIKMYTNWMHNFGDDAFFTKKITVQKVVKPNLLLNLKFEKEGYGKASKVVANFEVKDLKNNPLKNKTISFEVTVKGKKIMSKTIKTNSNGKANPTFLLPKNLLFTDVVLNVLIPFNGTTESISRSVPVVLDNIDLQFFPESGKMILGTTNKIAFKALNEFGKPVDVSGDIVDNKGKIVSSFNSFHDGMGTFRILTKKDSVYYAKIKTPFASIRKIKLPKVYKNGTRFSIVTDSLKTKLNVFTTQNKTLYLEVSNASKKLLSKTIKSNKKEIKIDTQDLPIGITKFSILDTNKNIVAERLVFINAHKKLNVAIVLDKEIYKTREKVKVSIKTTDYKNNPVSSNLSVAISDHKLLSFADDKQDHIMSYLLMSSELKGKIYKPSFYFNPKEPNSHLAIDYVMLTHGWRDYINKPEIIFENALYKPEQIGLQSGTVVDKKGNPVKAKLLLFNRNGVNVMVFESNKAGKFYFKSPPSSNLMLVAYAEDGTSLKIIDNSFKAGYYANNKSVINKVNDDKVKAFSKNKKPLQEIIKEEAITEDVKVDIALDDESAELEEVVIVGYAASKKRMITGSISHIAIENILHGETSIAQALQGRVAGVQITQDFAVANASKILIRGNNTISGNNSPLYVVDGVPYDTYPNTSVNEISSIDILKDVAATALYGCRATNGVILITTKNNNNFNNWNKKKLFNAKYNNYSIKHFYNNNTRQTYASKAFYVPKYNSKNLPKERTDFRETIYWNPVVQTNEQGNAEFEFYNSDAITSFKITAEGIGFNGLVGMQHHMYATNKILNVDFKSPNYMALNDTVILPITITNASKNSITANLELILPEHIKLVDNFDTRVVIDANTSIIKNIKVMPVKKADNVTIQLALKSKDFSDTVKRQATILSPYFPTQVSISGSKSQVFNFDINHVVENSLEAQFNIYTDIVGDVMNGIEGLIRKPYGCFEQTSSSTYPNIMVLKYLKESGKSNPDIEAKAMNFIKEGYERLISFETKEGGFEWFGHTPPHETLTAYGILEFTEMKEIYGDVDQKMIDRTVTWLLGRKDGKGGFDKSEKGYDSFASSPSDVANAYIIYALSEAKIKADINFEFTTAYNDAIESNDTYKMALMALSSYNLNLRDKAEILTNKIKQNIEKYNFKNLPVTNTITRSYGDAKNIETTAFTLLALMKNNTNNDAIIAKGMEYLVSKRQGGTFGSTQSTAMALKALIEYTKIQKQNIIGENDAIELVINGTIIKRQLTMNGNGKITIDGITKYIHEGAQNIIVKFTNPEVTFSYGLNITWDSDLPNSSKNCQLGLKTVIENMSYKVGDNVSMSINVSNRKNKKLGMATAIIGIPSGTTPQPWQLKALLEEEKMAYYEVFDNYLVFYWRAFNAQETKTIRLDLKADIAGHYKAPASTAYLYYGDEHKTWIAGNTLKIGN